MGLIRAVARRLRSGVARHLGLLDAAVAVALTAGGLIALSRLHYQGPSALAAVSCVVVVGAVGVRRKVPQAAQVLVATSVTVYQSISRDPQGAFVSAAVVLVGYEFGRSVQRTARYGQAAVVLGYCLAVLEIGLYPSHQSTPAGTAGQWLTIILLPTAVGVAVERRAQLARELAKAAGRLRDEQRTRAERAAAEERNRVARDLHDVVAHHLSVMAIQAGAARTVADRPEAAAAALRTVAAAGRDALSELRCITGGLRRGDERWECHPPRLNQLDALGASIRAAGVTVEMRASGDLDAVPPGIDLAAYRIVQEALTNVVKHAATTKAAVEIEVSSDVVHISVTNDGADRGVPPQPLTPSGQGLIGMRERVDLNGGRMSAGHRPGGGFEVRAAIPLQPAARTRPVAALGSPSEPKTARGRAWPNLRRHTDGLLALWLVAMEVEAVTSRHRHGSLALNMGVVAAMAALGVWRRRWPVAFLIAVGLLALPLSSGLTTLRTSTVTGTYVLVVPIYAVAVSKGRIGAVAGLLVWQAGVIAVGASTHAPAAGVAGATLMAAIIWVAARVWRNCRQLHHELTDTISQLQAEESEREKLAVANQRALIAQDLDQLVARQVVDMVVQAEAAETDRRPEYLYAAAAVIEDTGRQALGRMRDILGVLRVHASSTERRPQPDPDERAAKSTGAFRLATLRGDRL